MWSAEHGYPGDGRYREFYRDAGQDRNSAELGPLLLDNKSRRNIGIKYHRVTGRGVALGEKRLYQRCAGLAAAAEHALHFVESRTREAQVATDLIGQPPVIAAPFDAELFGHWWFEGPEFLDAVGRLCTATRTLEMTRPMDAVATIGALQIATPATSSWGWGGYSQTWLSADNRWMWPYLRDAAARLAQTVAAIPLSSPLQERALKQAARELVLATSSDWPFMVTAGPMAAYGQRRVVLISSDFTGWCRRLTKVNQIRARWPPWSANSKGSIHCLRPSTIATSPRIWQVPHGTNRLRGRSETRRHDSGRLDTDDDIRCLGSGLIARASRHADIDSSASHRCFASRAKMAIFRPHAYYERPPRELSSLAC